MIFLVFRDTIFLYIMNKNPMQKTITSLSQSFITSPEKLSNKNRINTLHHQFQTYGKNAREWMRKCIMMLPAIDRERVWEKKKFGSLSEYTSKLAGMSHKTTIDGLRIMQTVEHMPDIMRIIEKRGIAIIRPILLFLTPDNQKSWSEKIKIMSQHTLEMYVHDLKIQQDPSMTKLSSRNNMVADKVPELNIFGERALSEKAKFPHQKAIEMADSAELPESKTSDLATAPIKKIFAIELEPYIIEQLEKLNGKDGDWNQLMKELLQTRETTLAQEQQYIQNEVPQAGGERLNGSDTKETLTCSRYIPARIRHFILKRSRGLCEYRTCKRTYEIIHHTQRFALQKIHDPQHMVALCIEHERLAHLTLIENEEQSPRNWKIRNEPDEGLVGSSQRAKYKIDQMVQTYRKPG